MCVARQVEDRSWRCGSWGLIEEMAGGFRMTALDEDDVAAVYAVRSVLQGLIVDAVAPKLTARTWIRCVGVACHMAQKTAVVRALRLPAMESPLCSSTTSFARSPLIFVNSTLLVTQREGSRQ